MVRPERLDELVDVSGAHHRQERDKGADHVDRTRAKSARFITPGNQGQSRPN